VNKVNKDNTVISGPSLVETAAGRKLHVTTRTAVLQVLSESPNKQRKIMSTTNTSDEALRILRQNIQGLRGKSDEMIDSLYPTLPHVLCFTEHHLNQREINLTQIDSYTLGTSFCRNSLKMGGVCIFVNKNLNYMNIDLQKFSQERDIEAGAFKISVNSVNICILTIYRAPSSNFTHFLDKLELILNLLHSNNVQLIICGDINVNYLVESNKISLLDSLLASYNLTSTVHFPTRIQNNSATAIDNIFINTFNFGDYVILSTVNGLSDHGAQLITLNKIHLKTLDDTPHFIRKFNKQGIFDFRIMLSLETWDNVFENDDINLMYNFFLNTYLRIFHSSFPLKKLITMTNGNVWITMA